MVLSHRAVDWHGPILTKSSPSSTPSTCRWKIRLLPVSTINSNKIYKRFRLHGISVGNHVPNLVILTDKCRNVLIVLGNPRGNENPALLTLNIVWFRWHNFVKNPLPLDEYKRLIILSLNRWQNTWPKLAVANGQTTGSLTRLENGRRPPFSTWQSTSGFQNGLANL